MNINSATSAPPPRAADRCSLARALNAGDLDTASACFARDGCLITPDATAIHGRGRIRPVLAQLIARRTEIEVEQSSAVAAGDVVLVQERWRLQGGTEKSRIAQILCPTLALRLVEDEWKLVIAAPWGWARAAA